MKKIVGVLCLTIFVCSLGWELTWGLLSLSPSPNMVNIGNVSVSEGVTLKCINGELTIISGAGIISVEHPWVDKVNKSLWFASALFSLAAGIILLKKQI